MGDNEQRIVAFDSNILTYFLDGNRGNYRLAPTDPIADQRIAAFRLFLYCRTTIVPTVRAEAERIPNAEKLNEHMRFIDYKFGEFLPDDRQEKSIQRRADELLRYHPKGANDCRVLAEVEEDGDIPVLVTWDKGFRNDLAGRTAICLESPTECWERLGISRGTRPNWAPYGDHPLTNETWWRWD